MRFLTRLLVLSLFLFVFIPPGFAAPVFTAEQKKETTMPEVVVQGHQSLSVPNYQTAKKNIEQTAGGVNIVNPEQYKEGRASTLQDSLGYSAGVYIQPRFGSDEARLSIRGSGIQRTFHMRGIKLLQDGIPINQADGGGDFQSIEPLALQYIEVYRGANALQYGGTTLGGAINFVSPTGYTAPLVQGRFEGGGFGYLRDQISSGAVLGPADYFVSLSETRQKGFRNHSEQENKRLFSNYGLRLGDNAETRFYVNAVDSISNLPGNLTMAQMKQNPEQPNPANLAQNQKRNYDLVQVANKTTFKGDEQSFDAGVFYVHKDLFHPIFQVIDQITHDFGATFRYLNEKDLLGRKNLLTLGFNPVWNLASDLRHTNVGGERGTRTAESLQRSYNLDLYAEDQFYIFDKVALVEGLQWSYASRYSRDKFLSDGNNSAHPTYIGISPKTGVRYDVTEHSQVFANFSRSFEPPSFGELTNVAGGGVLDLTEQTASTIEIGTRGEVDRFSWDTAYYYSWVDNELLSLSDPAGNPLGTVNAYDTTHQGIEAGFGIDLLRGIFVKQKHIQTVRTAEGIRVADFFGWNEEPAKPQDEIVLRGIYNWSRFRFQNDPVFADNPLPGLPEHFLRFELMYEHPRGFYAGPNMEFASKYSVDMNHTLFTYSYALLGLKAGYRAAKGFSIFIEAKNLTNEIYAATTGVIANANGLDSAQFLPGDGRSVISGIEFRW